MTTRDHNGHEVDPSDVLAPDELAVYQAQRGDRRYEWTLDAASCPCGARIPITDTRCLADACQVDSRALVAAVEGLQASGGAA